MEYSSQAAADGSLSLSGRPDRLGRYLLRREIGRGFSSVVFEADDLLRRRTVALKVLTFLQNLSPERRGDLRERFAREARAISALCHPGVVAVYEAGQAEDGREFIAMELLPGETLRARLQRERALPPGEAVRIALQVADALQYAHGRGVIHRDVKPDNVFLLPDGRVKLVDFGVAHVLSDGALTQTGAVIGSPAYMSPEQIHGERLDGRSDVFSLGVMLAEMVVGHKPFDAATVPAVMHRILNHPPRLGGVTPRTLRTIIGKSLSKNRRVRFQSAAAMADALRHQVLPGLPVSEPTSTLLMPPPGSFPQGRRSPTGRAGRGAAVLLGLPLLGAVYLAAHALPHSHPPLLGQPERAVVPAGTGVVRHTPTPGRRLPTLAARLPERSETPAPARPTAVLPVRIAEEPPLAREAAPEAARPVTGSIMAARGAPAAGMIPPSLPAARKPQPTVTVAAPAPAPPGPMAPKKPIVRIAGFRQEQQTFMPPTTPGDQPSAPADGDWERIDVADAPPVSPGASGLPASAPRLLHRNAPIYPATTWAAGREGTTTLRVFVDEDGDVTGVKVIDSAGAPLLDRAAAQAAWQWEFEPAFRGGRAVPSQVTERVSFPR